jgi:NAD(P)-dependent dehydrogenase (short-subunit alcohol dehydrogenase family)
MQSSQTVVITGASSGIGLALATAFAGRGARVVANSRRVTQSKTLAPSPNLVLVDGDIASPEVAARVIEAADRFGGVDLLVNNAGVFIAKPFTQYTSDDLAALVSTNLNGFFHVTQFAVRGSPGTSLPSARASPISRSLRCPRPSRSSRRAA